MCHMTSITSNQLEECATFGDECDNPYLTLYQSHPFCVAANARNGLRDEQYLLSWVVEAFNVGEQGEVLDAAPAPQQLEDGVQLNIDELVEMNLETEDDPQPTFVSASLTPKERENYREFLMEFHDCFAWSYEEMPGLDPQVATHRLDIDPRF
jgi:hypothetical protein